MNGQKLCTKYSVAKRKCTAVFALGDKVSVKVPRNGRVGSDALRVPGKTVKESKGDIFRIRTESGVGVVVFGMIHWNCVR